MLDKDGTASRESFDFKWS